ncbi:PAS domain S-box protein [Parvularcula sp. ZS-1/3]|uniref:histidine kinase n=1 Tax=Parvularcula mediterranea TaxID=2732508 RepID=A0A7Y3RMQ1_9PROT|nr:ATP-binding protein [Parvularcula mediterranea]NNU16840.1 PAS domain S-box protein [Parvularcula mediterranea]
MGERSIIPTRIAKAWADLPLTRKGLVVVIVPLVILIGSLLTLYRASYIEARAEDDVRRAFAIQRDIYQVHALLAEAASGVRGYLLTGEERFLDPYEKADRDLPATLGRLDVAIEDRGVREAYEVFLTQADRKRAGLDDLLERARTQRSEAGLSDATRALLAANKDVLDDLRRQIDVIQELEGALLDARRERVERVRDQYLLQTAVSAVIGALGSLAAVVLFSTGIVRRVHQLEENAERLQRGAPLAAFPPATDEIGTLATKLDRASALLRAREQDLRESEERFRLVVEEVRDYGIFVLTPEGKVATWNTGAQRIKGWQADEIIGEHFSIFYPEETRAFLPAHMLARATEQGSAEDEGWRVRKDGTRFWANVIITALRDEDGVLRGFAKVTRDITERKQSEEALEEAREQAIAANLAKSEFLSRTSHELRTPMSAILGFTQVLELDSEELPESHKRAVTQISKAARHLLSLINDLLDISSIEAGGSDVALEATPLDEVLSEAHGLSAPIVKTAGLNFTLTPLGRGQTVLCDRRRTVQVILNLVTNAAKYNVDGSFISLSATEEDGRAVISVSDDGPGIAQADLPRLFTPFDRLGRDRRKGAEGSGLGLALSKRLVESMDGTISVETEEGEGATFSFTLPLAEEPQPTTVREGVADELSS